MIYCTTMNDPMTVYDVEEEDTIEEEDKTLARRRQQVIKIKTFQHLRHIVCQRRLSQRLLVVSIQHDYISRLRRAFDTFKTPFGPRAMSIKEQQIKKAYNWQHHRLLSSMFGMWVGYIQEQKQLDEQSLAQSESFFYHHAMQKYFPKFQKMFRLHRQSHRAMVLGDRYVSTLRLFEGLEILRHRTLQRCHQRQQSAIMWSLSVSLYRHRKLQRAMTLWHQHMTAWTLHLHVISEAKAKASTRSGARSLTGVSTRSRASTSIDSVLEHPSFLLRHQRLLLWFQRWQQCTHHDSHHRQQCIIAHQQHQHRCLTMAISQWMSYLTHRHQQHQQTTTIIQSYQQNITIHAFKQWQRIHRRIFRLQKSAVTMGEQHFAFLGQYRRCVRVFVACLGRLKRALLHQRKHRLALQHHQKYQCQQGWCTLWKRHRKIRLFAAWKLRSEFHWDMKRMSIGYQGFLGYCQLQQWSKQSLIKGVLIWKMSRLLTGIHRWRQWTSRQIEKRAMLHAAKAGYTVDMTARACRVIVAAAASMKEKQQHQRRQHLIFKTLRQWKKVVLRNQLEREKIRQRGYMLSSMAGGGGSGVSEGVGHSQGLWCHGHGQGRDVDVHHGKEDGEEETVGVEEGRWIDLIKAKPRPLAPFLIFLNNGSSGGSSGVGTGYGTSHLVCALGTSTGLLNTAVVPTKSQHAQSNVQSNIPVKMSSLSHNDRTQSDHYSVMESWDDKTGLEEEKRQQSSLFSSPTSITNSLRYMSPYHHTQPRHQRDVPTASMTNTTASTATTTSTTASRVGLAHALPRISILSGGSLFDGLHSPVKITAPSQTSQSK